MPTSHRQQIPDILDLIELSHPQRLLDIGIGFGKYGLLTREYLEIWEKHDQYGVWQVKLDGIEGFPDYIRPWHKEIYDDIFLGDARTIVPTLTTRYDMTLIIDVLEHFTYADGWELIQHLEAHTRNILISTPKYVGVQGAEFGNDYEIHRFQWHPRHFRELGEVFVVPNPYSWILYCGADAQALRQAWEKREKMLRRDRQRDFLQEHAPVLLQVYRHLPRPR